MSLIKLCVDDVDAFKVACDAADINIKSQKVLLKKTYFIVSVRTPSQLYELGLIQSGLKHDGYHEPNNVLDTMSKEKAKK
jgi:hypothetical protein